MPWLVSIALLFMLATPALCDDALPSRPLGPTFAELPNRDFVNFDIYDMREEARAPAARTETQPHSIFIIKHHVGIGAGYDNGIPHGSLGFYITVAELGRWNFGIPSPALGFGRYPEYDAKRKQAFTKSESTIFISLASVHYRVSYLPSLGVNWYVNFEQVFDMRQNMTGSQVGFTISTK